ncbi:MAG: DNA polymerase III subunit gamma/tau [Patescibacteria group bacterium]|nr:DNA polymerase III subunit gamma/tau [Patescibacteria group bacterium]
MTVLYRTYRPQKWSDVIGQDQTVEALKDSVKNGRIAHAYLFSGSRGTGKTSVARILAREAKASDEDIYEIDAASNRGIDDIRQLREHVAVLPFSSPFKVYIIDEAHMLSKDAWNALLKTLEEPPAHVIFILATTELDKVPETIVSRCQAFAFRTPGKDVIRKQIMAVAKKEGVSLDPGAADLIALLGDGSFRDALGTLEKVMAASKGGAISRETAEAVTGAPHASLVDALIAKAMAKDADGALAAIGTAEDAGISMDIFMSLVLEKMRLIFLLQNSPSSKASIAERVSPDDMGFIEKHAAAKAMSPSLLSAMLEAAEGTRRAAIKALPLELAVARYAGGE